MTTTTPTEKPAKQPKPEPVEPDDDQDDELDEDELDDQDEEDDGDDEPRTKPKKFADEHPPAKRRKPARKEREVVEELPSRIPLRFF